MQLVHERAPDGFDDIDAVITRAEIDEVTEAYRRTAGFALEALLEDSRSIIDRPLEGDAPVDAGTRMPPRLSAGRSCVNRDAPVRLGTLGGRGEQPWSSSMSTLIGR